MSSVSNKKNNILISLAEDIWNKLANYKFFNSKNKDNSLVYYQIKPLKEDDNILAYWQWFISSLIWTDTKIDFYVIWNSKNVKIYVSIPLVQKDFFENSFFSSFQNADLISVKKTKFVINNYLYLKNHSFFSRQDFMQDWIYVDPFNNIYSLYYDIPSKYEFVSSYSYDFEKKNNLFLSFFKSLISFFSKIIFLKFEETDTEDTNENPLNKINIAVWFYSEESNWLDFRKKYKSIFKKIVSTWDIKIVPNKSYFEIDEDAVINFFHLPTKEFQVKNLEYLEYKKISYPWNIPTLENSNKNDVTLLGYTDYKNDNVKFWIRNEDKFRHMYVIWKTWMWKSTLISNMVRSDMLSNKWLSVIDPHWDLVDTLLEHIPSWRTNDVILFDVADYEYPIWFNILEYSTEEEKNLVVSWIVGTFKKLYWESRWPRLEYILRNVILSLIEYPQSTLLHLIRVLKDKDFREEVLTYVKDPIVIKFRREEFDKWNDKFKDEAIAPIINKVWQFLSSPLIRNIFGQSKTQMNIRKLMDEWKILLINLSKWKIWEDNAAMIWSFIVTKFQIDAMSRADISFNDRRDFYLYIDEFQNFATESFESILSEARKYKLSLIVANQYISQINEKIRWAIFWNVWTIISFWLWFDDWQLISSQFKSVVSPNDIVSLPKFKAYARIMVDGTMTEPFSMTTFPLPSSEDWDITKDKIKKQSRQRYAVEKSRLEALIQNWSDKKFSKVEKAVEKAKLLNTNISKEKNQNVINHDIKSSKSVNLNNNIIEEKKDVLDINLINNLNIWDYYDWIVKLKYNYWLFVMFWDFEWLLHKKKISVPEWVKWKDMYDIWDPIKVKVEWFKDVDWQSKVIWSQI